MAVSTFLLALLAPGAGGAGAPAPGVSMLSRERLPLELRIPTRNDSIASAVVRTDHVAARRSRAWELSVEQSLNNGVGGPGLLGSGGTARDTWADGADARGIPNLLLQIVGDSRLRARGHFDPPNQYFSRDTVQAIGRAFANEWTPVRGSVGPDAVVTQRFGEDFRLLGHVLQVDEAAHWRRGHSLESSTERLYLPDGSPIYEYQVERGVASTRLGGSASLGLPPVRGQAVRAPTTIATRTTRAAASAEPTRWSAA